MTVTIVHATTNISSTYPNYYAWNDIVRWMDFNTNDQVIVQSLQLRGYASSSFGDISLDCETTRNNNICSGANGNYKVVNDGAGNLSGWAWNDIIGWISFCGVTTGGTTNCPTSTVAYRVQIDSSGIFGGLAGYGWAWNDVVGWMSFNCNNTGCGTSDYKVVTTWQATSTTGTLDSTTYDTGVNGGAAINSLLWHGSLPAGTEVRFQLATSNTSSGPWSFMGSDGTSASYYGPLSPDTVLKVDYTLHNNKRYFRYRVILYSDTIQTLSPRVDDIIVNWSP